MDDQSGKGKAKPCKESQDFVAMLDSTGLCLFPASAWGAPQYQQMLDAARTVAEDLNGTLCDETRSTLTPQSINHLRERIADFRRRQMLKA